MKTCRGNCFWNRSFLNLVFGGWCVEIVVQATDSNKDRDCTGVHVTEHDCMNELGKTFTLPFWYFLRDRVCYCIGGKLFMVDDAHLHQARLDRSKSSDELGLGYLRWSYFSVATSILPQSSDFNNSKGNLSVVQPFKMVNPDRLVCAPEQLPQNAQLFGKPTIQISLVIFFRKSDYVIRFGRLLTNLSRRIMVLGSVLRYTLTASIDVVGISNCSSSSSSSSRNISRPKDIRLTKNNLLVLIDMSTESLKTQGENIPLGQGILLCIFTKIQGHEGMEMSANNVSFMCIYEKVWNTLWQCGPWMERNELRLLHENVQQPQKALRTLQCQRLAKDKRCNKDPSQCITAASTAVFPPGLVQRQVEDGLRLSDDRSHQNLAPSKISLRHERSLVRSALPAAAVDATADVCEQFKQLDCCLITPEKLNSASPACARAHPFDEAQSLVKLRDDGTVPRRLLAAGCLAQELSLDGGARSVLVYFGRAGARAAVPPVPLSGSRSNRLVLSLQAAEPRVHAVELVRLASFLEWPHLGKFSALQYASAGFYCTAVGDEVACFSCGLALNKWSSGVDPLAVHREKCAAGQCQWISDPRASGNVALSETTVPHPAPKTDVGAEAIASHGASASSLFAYTEPNKQWASILAGAKTLMSPYVYCCSVLPVADCGYLLADPTKQQQLPRAPGIPASNDERQGRQEELMKFESCRLNTYTDAWQYSHIVTPRELASNGLYYTGVGDRVQCAFCQGALRNWEQGDRVDEQHARHFPYCRLVQGHDVGNVPIPFSPLISRTKDVPIILDTTDCASKPEDGLGISCSIPKHADFAVEARRLATFATWSPMHHLNADELAKAGFFYTGTQDAVRCFYCDNTVVDWQLNSDPWVEHAKRFPSCPFVQQVKGKDFVRQNNARDPESISSPQKTSLPVDPRELRARMDSPKVRILLQMDYPVDLVREVIQKRLATVGTDHETSEELLADVFAVHDEKQHASASRPAAGRQTTLVEPVVVRPPKVDYAPTSNANHPGAPVASAASAPSTGGRNRASQQEASVSETAVVPDLVMKQSQDEVNRQLKTQLTCKICMDAVVGIVFLPCGHLACCAVCAPALTSCPICRVSIRGTVRTVL